MLLQIARVGNGLLRVRGNIPLDWQIPEDGDAPASVWPHTALARVQALS
jgi:hypothetical protein